MVDAIQVRPYSPEMQADWDEFLRKSRSPLFMFERGFMDYHADRFQDASLVFYRGNRMLAVFPANYCNNTVYSHQGLTYGGLITAVNAKSTDIESAFSVMATHYRAAGVHRVIYKKVPWCFSVNFCEEDVYFLHRQGAKLIRRDLSSVIDLISRPKLSDSRKNLLKKAAARNLVCMPLNDVEIFHTLLSAALSKHNAVPVHSPAELQLLSNLFPEQLRLHGAYLDGELLAAACLFDFGRIVHTQYLAASQTARQIGAMDYLLEKLIHRATADGKKFFSFGISTEDAGTYLNQGLIAQKEGFGARGLAVDFYEWNFQ